MTDFDIDVQGWGANNLRFRILLHSPLHRKVENRRPRKQLENGTGNVSCTEQYI
jgi:hypothetical protein